MGVYVLKKARKEEQSEIDTALANALAVMPLVLTGEMQNATQTLHTNC